MGSSFFFGRVEMLPYLFATPALLSLFYLAFLPLVPESPMCVLRKKEDYNDYLDETTNEVRLIDLEKVATNVSAMSILVFGLALK